MAKWYGKVGYVTTEKSELGVWKPISVERPYSGDVMSNSIRRTEAGKVNDDLSVANRISIVADPFAYENFSAIKYVEFMGNFWEVSTAEVQFPRIILSLGGAYSGRQQT